VKPVTVRFYAYSYNDLTHAVLKYRFSDMWYNSTPLFGYFGSGYHELVFALDPMANETFVDLSIYLRDVKGNELEENITRGFYVKTVYPYGVAEVSGLVKTQEGLPCPGLRVELRDYWNGTLYAWNYADSSGHYKLTLSIPNDIWLGVYLDVPEVPEGYFNYTSGFFMINPWNWGWLYKRGITLTRSYSGPSVLLVVDNDGLYHITPGVDPSAITQVLDELQLSYSVWLEEDQGIPPVSLLKSSRSIFWHTGTYWDWAIEPRDREHLLELLNDGRLSLVVEGEDVGYNRGNDFLLTDVLRANYLVDDTGVSGLHVTNPTHPIAQGLPDIFTFPSKPPFLDGVSPISGAVEIFRYYNTDSGEDTPYSALIAYESGRSRVAYVAFPIHWLDEIARTKLIGNLVYWVSQAKTLSDFPAPFVNATGYIDKTFIIIPISDPHGPCGAAHTMDTMGGILIAARLGLDAVGGRVQTAMDSYSYISTYNYGTAKVTMTDTANHLVVLASPGVDQVTYYYNELRNASGARVLPVLFLRDAQGDYLYVQSSGHAYRVEYDNLGRVSADYGVIQIYPDEGRYVLLVYGLGGEGTKAAAKVVSEYDQWNLTGRAVVVKYYDSDANGYLDTITIVERVP
jgi:hypothetical protein